MARFNATPEPSFARRALAAFGGQGGQAASALLLTLVVARAVPPSVRGEFVLLVLIPQLGSYLVTLGLPAALSRALVQNAGIRGQLLTTSFGAALICALAMSAATPALLALADASRPHLALIVVANVAATWLIFASWFGFGLQRYVWAGAIRAAPALAAAAGILVYDSARGGSLSDLYAIWTAAQLLAAVGVAWRLSMELGWALPSRPQLRGWLGYGARFYIYHAAQIMSLRVDQWVLGALASTAAVGVYSIAASLHEAVLLAARAVGLVIFVDAAKGVGRRQFRRQLHVSLLASTAAAALLAIAAGPLVRTVFGEAYAEAARPLQILLLGTPGLVLLRLITTRLAGRGEPGRASVCSLVTLAVTLALDVALIPAHGAVGAAWASAIGYTVGGGMAVSFEWIPFRLPKSAPASPGRADASA